MSATPRLLTLKAVAVYLSVSPSTVRRLAERGEIPSPIKLSERLLRWDRNQLEALFERPERRKDDPDELLARWEDENRKKAAQGRDR